jgi:hypothetical protein
MTDDRIATEADVVTKLAASHHLTADLAANLSGISALTDALVTS